MKVLRLATWPYHTIAGSEACDSASDAVVTALAGRMSVKPVLK
jgi:hypothetical protein